MMKTAVFLSLGSNICKEENIARALNVLADCFGEIDISSIYESEAVGFTSDNFFNCVVMAYTVLPLPDLLELLRQIEFDFGRSDTAQKNEPRSLDIDLLLYGDCYINSPVKLPREDIITKAFVLEPLAELIPGWLHPDTQLTLAEMWSNFDQHTQPQWPVKFLWRDTELPQVTLCDTLEA